MKRYGIRIRGIVQGVGFRPFVALIARRNRLTGYVLNDTEGVFTEIEGEHVDIQDFMRDLYAELPPLAQIDSIEINELALKGERDFLIVQSVDGCEKNTLIAPDVAPCQACINEMVSPENRRYNFPFINCTHCGPRYTLIKKVPYDRKNTSMAPFIMCSTCKREYTDELDRRYHAEPTACNTCGPIYMVAGYEDKLTSVASIAYTKKIIHQGLLAAVKGIGGYHIVCDANNEESVQRLRTLKCRPAKPLALMVGSLERAKELCEISPVEEKELTSMARPIVLLKRRKDNFEIAPSVAIGTSYLGIMLPYTPMHYLLLDKKDVFVMTSANHHGEPVLFDDIKAKTSLGPLCDVFLYNNRNIEAPVDDSVMMVVDQQPYMVRRARGYVPRPITIQGYNNHKDEEQILAVGSDLKNTFALSKGNQVFVGPHIGDLENMETYERYRWNLDHIQSMFSIEPSVIVADLHPNFFSTNFAKEYAEKHHIPLILVQHHHSHIASVMAEHAIDEPVLGMALDGTGYGEDGHIWGGEIVKVDGVKFERLAHIAYTPLPGNEAAIKEPWRQALWYIREMYGLHIPNNLKGWFKGLPNNWQMLYTMMAHTKSMAITSSAGRLFEVVGSLLGLGYKNNFEGELAIKLEQLAGNIRGEVLPYSLSFIEKPYSIDFKPTVNYILEKLVEHEDPSYLAASFHKTIAHAFVALSKVCLQEENINKVVCSGGVFQNKRLLAEIKALWPEQTIYLQSQVPANDGGISLGQIWIARAMLAKDNLLKKENRK